ncbi:hypothetical protein [Fodinibius salsisoli]|uniref:Uncharacterized protein n=1 Tax=Fodinibius salsisoli TaxID=2820877 RepID=A0ABT3PJ28_9BACT|nr:hypothetical protein [Fodinibius salsisoli]MCW9705778.1 hypothetical protein [Fodinibius salsisoli]
MSIDQYLKQTKYAIEQLLQNFSFYSSLYRDLYEKNRKVDSLIFDDYIADPEHPDYKNEIKRWQRNNHEDQKEFCKALSKIDGAGTSKNAIAGAILQIAFMGINIYSNNDSIPETCEELHNSLTKSGSKLNLRKFGVGKTVWGKLPMGLVIYAGRNQYNHFDEHPNFENELVEKILDRLATFRDEDKIFKTNHIKKHNTAQHILGILHWQSYGDYKKDMIEALKN